MNHVTRNAERGSLGEFRTFRDREGRARQECDSFRTFGWTKVIIFLYFRKYTTTVLYNIMIRVQRCTRTCTRVPLYTVLPEVFSKVPSKVRKYFRTEVQSTFEGS